MSSQAPRADTARFWIPLPVKGGAGYPQHLAGRHRAQLLLQLGQIFVDGVRYFFFESALLEMS
jgi:hypothetical protein